MEWWEDREGVPGEGVGCREREGNRESTERKGRGGHQKGREDGEGAPSGREWGDRLQAMGGTKGKGGRLKGEWGPGDWAEMEGIGRKGKEGLSGKCEGYAKKGMGTERKSRGTECKGGGETDGGEEGAEGEGGMD